ncbi:MAG: hypothetical protein GW815_00415 [Candidatus Moranbacteria bacterium]|nr:hypothetical protein [Candidatus Moranbacteria bacterium]OIQ02687.1 MAG: hypothetical protein AUK58_02535 [Candidatus Moranbacteria bacterium CG2_30_41_165]PIP25232.1 MAG: hypothetical protein COX32_04465 [Candidatus Moranbacteria bacterium CG23_combo_of_CG06-09_8_20_14_all_41_28]PIV86188.1 MAG: hypothetical protein COW50_02810 [Candidatus Moranbacteria bacterium CG17_big_fil_post_rev_8_21_14_2_50_41_107]PIW94511.1 MAG: hypothetical protein COZ86_00535 [Candidatus Moranbacteria bacterium CG_
MVDEKILRGEKGNGIVEQSNGGQNREENNREFTVATGPENTIEGGKEQSEGKLNEILSQATPSSSQVTADDGMMHALDAKSISESTDEESKIQKLLDLAGTKGLVHAVKVARSLSDYYALDRMHDELVDKFYEGLIAKGLITKE